MTDSADDPTTKVQDWLADLDEWFKEIDRNGYYHEWVYCYFDPSSGNSQMGFSLCLTVEHAAPEDVLRARKNKLEQFEGDENKSKTESHSLHKALKAEPDNLRTSDAQVQVQVQVQVQGQGQGQGQIEVQSPFSASESARTHLETGSETDKQVQPRDMASQASRTNDNKQAGAKPTAKKHGHEAKLKSNTLESQRESLDSLSGQLDLSAVLLSGPPPEKQAGMVLLPALIVLNPALLDDDAGCYGILLRAALLAKVSSSKANLNLYINRLESLRELFRGAADQIVADGQPISELRRACVLRQLWGLLDGVRDLGPILQDSVKVQHLQLKSTLTEGTGVKWREPWLLIWYQWNLTMPRWINKHNHKLTLFGHILTTCAFVSLLLFTLHPTLGPAGGVLSDGLAHLVSWRALLPDSISLAACFAALAAIVYGVTTHRLTLLERVALHINDKIEKTLDSHLVDLMKANMDVQIGRLGCKQPPSLIPESVCRELDEAFALKELINSYESTVRARRRHVAEEVSKEHSIRMESQQRLRNAALGVTASFVLLEIGSKIQGHRDLQSASDHLSYAYWLEHSKSASTPGQPAGATDGMQVQAAGLPPLSAVQDCVQSTSLQSSELSPVCLSGWRDSALASSSQLLFFVFLIAMLIFAVRVMYRTSESDRL